MMINQNNYEEYLVRYLDGECSSNEVAAIDQFLLQHPYLNAELNALKATILSADEKVFLPGKELLKKGISIVNYENYFIRNIEGDLSVSELTDLNFFLSVHPELQHMMRAFSATKLVEDPAIVFPDIKLLKKQNGKVREMYVRYSVVITLAACLMLIIMMKGIRWNESSTNSPLAKQSVSQNEKMAPDLSAKKENHFANPASENDEKVAAQAFASNGVAKNANHFKKNNSAQPSYNKYANVSVQNYSPSEKFVSSNEKTQDDMAHIGSVIQSINYKPAFKKAMFRTAVSFPGNEFVFSGSNQTLKFSSVATVLGSELLKLSGREDYLKTTNAFNDNSEERKKLPVTLIIKGDKFNFYHKFFKHRNNSSSQQK